MKARNFINNHSLAVYLFLAFVISWGLIIILAGPVNIPIDTAKSKELLPILYVSMLFGPSVAGLLMIGILEGKKGFRRIKSGLLNWRHNISWYILALFATPVLASLILIILSFFSTDFHVGLIESDNVLMMCLNGIIIGIFVGFFEELGWTGFVIPRITLKYNILTSGIFVGVVWGLWHFILFWEVDSFFGVIPLLILLGRLLAWLPPFRVFMVWIYKKTGSLLLTILTHASLVFTTTVIVPMTLTGKSLLVWLITWGITLWILVIIFPIVDRKLENRQVKN
jgi:membrane protease YdiL (CAAX protease family)